MYVGITHKDKSIETDDVDLKSAVSLLSILIDLFLPQLISIYNLVHNIFELYNVLIQTRLTTSKTKRDILYSKLGTRVASQVAKRLKI